MDGITSFPPLPEVTTNQTNVSQCGDGWKSTQFETPTSQSFKVLSAARKRPWVQLRFRVTRNLISPASVINLKVRTTMNLPFRKTQTHASAKSSMETVTFTNQTIPTHPAVQYLLRRFPANLYANMRNKSMQQQSLDIFQFLFPTKNKNLAHQWVHINLQLFGCKHQICHLLTKRSNCWRFRDQNPSFGYFDANKFRKFKGWGLLIHLSFTANHTWTSLTTLPC